MLNFSVGPVQMDDEIRYMGSDQIPYFRTPEFSAVMLENERLFKTFTKAPNMARTVFLTGSGTAAMEAAVMGTLHGQDKALVVDGGSFGRRFAQLCMIHGIPHDIISLQPGHPLLSDDLKPYEDKGYTAFLVNYHETSTGVLYDLSLISAFCKRNDLVLLVDAISAFLADPLDVASEGIDVLIASSQKALALPPGVSALTLSPRAIERIERVDPRCLYFDLRTALSDGERGQTPFTPAVGVLLQMNARLRQVEQAGGVEVEISKVAAQACDFRSRVANLPFDVFSLAPSNAVTALVTRGLFARRLFSVLKNEYGIWICPNGGKIGERLFRVGHIGSLSVEDNIMLISAFEDIVERGLLEVGSSYDGK